jgi:hypothetical protein
VRLQRDLERRLARFELGRFRRELDDGVAQVAGQPVIGEDDGVLRLYRRRDAAAPASPVPAHLEQIDEIHLKQQGDANVVRPRVEVAHRQALVGAARPDELRPDEMDRVLRDVQAAARVEEVGISQIGGQERVVVLDDRAEQQGPAVIDQQLQAGQETHVLVIETLGAAFPRHDVAVVVEHAERVAVLQRARPALLQ